MNEYIIECPIEGKGFLTERKLIKGSRVELVRVSDKLRLTGFPTLSTHLSLATLDQCGPTSLLK